MRRILGLSLALVMLIMGCAAASDGEDLSIEEYVELDDEGNEIAVTAPEEQTGETAVSRTAKEDFIDDIIALGEKLYNQADGTLVCTAPPIPPSRALLTIPG